MHATRTRPPVEVSADGAGVVSRLLADLADQTTLTGRLSQAFAGRRARQTAHDPGRVLTDLAVMIADGGEAISDIATLADQPGVFGKVASDSTCWRVLNSIGKAELTAVGAARAQARTVAWAQRAEQTGVALPASLVAGAPLLDAAGRPGLVIDEDATIVITHSEKESTAATFKHTYGYHPVLAFCDNTNEALAGMLRPGNAGSNTAADHIAVVDQAPAQIDLPIIRRIKDDLAGWNLHRLVWAADRGLVSAANRAYLTRGGGHYIHAEKLRAHQRRGHRRTGPPRPL